MALKTADLQRLENGVLENAQYGDVYFQRHKGTAESDYVFLQGNNLHARFQNTDIKDFSIAELGFGSGLNFLLTAALWEKAAPPGAVLTYVSIEKHPITREDLREVYALFPEYADITQDILAQYPAMIEGFHPILFPARRIRLILALGDAADVLPQITGAFDAWYLDGFSPKKNPGMWREEFYPLIAAATKKGGTLSTFSSAGHVRRGLKAAGFAVRRIKGYGFKYAMTVAQMPGEEEEKFRPRTALVLGAGIAGCAVARALAARGLQVTVIDRQEGCARETSGNPLAIAYPKLTVDRSPLGEYHGHAFAQLRSLVRSLALPSWRACGVLHLDMDADDRKRSLLLMEKNEFPAAYAHIVDETPFSKTGYVQPEAGSLDPRALCAALMEHPGIHALYGRTTETIEKKAGGWQALDQNGHIIAAGDICVVALANTAKKFPQTAWLPLQSLRGQVSFAPETPETEKIKTVVCHEGYIAPAVDGIHSFGATFQKEDPSVPEARDADDAENAQKLALNLGIRIDPLIIAGGRAGYRATTPDKLPMAGPCPDYDAFKTGKPAYIDGLYLSTGFGAHGMTGAPLVAEIIAALATNSPLPVPQSLLAHLLPERFILRDIKRKKI